MKTKANQSAAEKNITMVALADIQPSGFNPRKRFDETGEGCPPRWNLHIISRV